MSRSSVTTWFEVIGLLLIAAAAGVGWFWWRLALALVAAGVALLLESMLLAALAPKPPATVEAE